VIVVDAGALLSAVLGSDQVQELRARIDAAPELHAPHVVDVEVLAALRTLVLDGALNVQRAQGALDDVADLPLVRYGHVGFTARVWGLRDHLNAYDAVAVALAEALEVPLVTTDDRIARAGGHHAAVEVY
jgi:predicted nucleic acid-binding protein